MILTIIYDFVFYKTSFFVSSINSLSLPTKTSFECFYRGYIEVDNLYYVIEPISDDYSTEGHVVYNPANHASFQNLKFADAVESLEVADEITKRKNSFYFVCINMQ